MNLLLVAFAFPPTNVIGAIRVGKLARYLHRVGHDLRVLTTEIGEDQSLPLEIPSECVVHTSFCEREAWLDRLVGRFGRHSAARTAVHRAASADSDKALRKFSRDILRRQYYGLMNIPDSRSDWVKTAIPAGRRVIEEWRPDLIFASAPPFTCLVVSSRLGRIFGIPWVADFRDLWVDNPYYSQPAWRRILDLALERHTVRDAAALVTVSPVWAEQLRRRHGKAAQVVYNGYAEEDIPLPSPREDRGERLTIRYTGSIYQGFRDPSAVFAAIGFLPGRLRDLVAVEFYGDCCEYVLALASAYRVRDRVSAMPPVPYRRALELQMTADVLLLLQWNDKRDEGNIPGKTFEYLRARRPILLVGYERGVAAQLIRERGAGLVSNTPEQIRDQLQTWIEDKRTGRLKQLDAAVSCGLSRDAQFRGLEDLLLRVVNERPG